MKLKPAEYVAFVMGGYREAARLIGRHHTAVSRWKSPRGLNGNVPVAVHRIILGIAKKKRWDITADDLLYGRVLSPPKHK